MPRRPLLLATAALTLGPALIHISVAPAHFAEWTPFGVLFLAAALVEVALVAALLLAPARPVLGLVAASDLALIAVWAWSRTYGVPVGPAAGRPEAVGLADIVCVTLEALSAAAAVVCMLTPPRRRRLPLLIGAAPAILPAALLSVVGVNAGANGMLYAHNVAPLVRGAAQVSVTMLTEAPGDQPEHAFTLVAAPATSGGHRVYAYNGTVPGPELRVRQGERVRVTLVNRLPVSTTVHWHGVVLPNAEDGVAGITQDAVAKGGSFTYEFLARDAGTFWYHSHQQTSSQLEAGLYGALVIEPASGLAQARDYTVLVHDAPDGSAAANGVRGGLQLDARPGETVRLRVINAVVPGMDGSPIAPALDGAPFRVAALDGQELPAAAPITGRRVPLGMGERADLVFTMPATGGVRLASSALQGEPSAFQKALLLAGVKPAASDWWVALGAGPPVAAAVAGWPLLDLARYAGPALTPAPDRMVPMVLGEHPGFRSGVPQLIHTLNGAAAPASPEIHVRTGERVRMHVVNETGEYHPMHLHGHVLSVAGTGQRGDTVLVAPHQTVDVDFTAANPGLWMLHCHVLLHAEMGMMTTVVYDGYATPFEIGMRSGNMPE